MTLERKKNWVLLDADDTILGVEIEGKVCGTHQAYFHAIDRFALTLEFLGFNPERAKTLQNEIDTQMAKEFGFSDKTRFARSMVEAYNVLSQETGRVFDAVIAATVKKIGLGVFEHRYIALPGAIPTMAEMHKYYNIAIVTKGEDSEQRKKVFDSGCFVYADHVIPLAHKSAVEWEKVVDDLRIGFNTRQTSWAIGNSVKSDINPPLGLGFNAIHVNYGEWSFEKAEYSPPLFRRRLEIVTDIKDVLKFVVPTTTIVQE
jgi:putative hydrolase of the HAD superfamily